MVSNASVHCPGAILHSFTNVIYSEGEISNNVKKCDSTLGIYFCEGIISSKIFVMIYYVYSYQKDTDTTQFCSFEVVFIYFSIKVYFAMLLYVLICCKWCENVKNMNR